jgi:hypothetical protein
MPKPTVTLQEYQERKAKAIERRKEIKKVHKEELLEVSRYINYLNDRIRFCKGKSNIK